MPNYRAEGIAKILRQTRGECIFIGIYQSPLSAFGFVFPSQEFFPPFLLSVNIYCSPEFIM